MSSPHGISLHVSIRVAPENAPKFLEAFKIVFDKIVLEPECLFFEVFQSPDDPGSISWVEDWNESKEWLMTVQISKEYYKEYFALTEPMFIEPRVMKVVNRVGPHLLVSKTS